MTDPASSADLDDLPAMADSDVPSYLSALVERIESPDEEARTQARHHLDALAKPVGALGRLEEVAAWLSALQGTSPPRVPSQPTLVIFAGDHGAAEVGVSAYPREVTAAMVQTFVAGGAAASVLADAAGATVNVVDVSVDADLGWLGAAVGRSKVRRGSGRIDIEDAMSIMEAQRSLAVGAKAADDAVDSGCDLLLVGDMGIGNTTVASTITSLVTGRDVVSMVGRGTGIDDETWMRKTVMVRDACRRGRPLIGDPLALMAAVTGPDLVAMTGLMLQAAARRTPVILDGVVTTAAALLSSLVAPSSAAWMLASHRSTEPAHQAALQHLGLDPLLDLHMRLGEGSGALIALPLVTAAARLATEMSSLDEVLDAARAQDER